MSWMGKAKGPPVHAGCSATRTFAGRRGRVDRDACRMLVVASHAGNDARLGVRRRPFGQAERLSLNYVCLSSISGDQQGFFLMRIAIFLSFVLLSAATLPAEAQDLPEHTVLAFNLPACPKGWQEYAPAAGALVAGVGDAVQLGRNDASPANVTVANANAASASKSKVAGLLFCERNKNRR